MGTPLRYLLNTHHHSDHVGGNLSFTSDMPLLAHPIVKTRLATWAAGIVGQENQALTNAIQQQRDRNANPAVIAELERAQGQLRTGRAESFLPTREVKDGEERTSAPATPTTTSSSGCPKRTSSTPATSAGTASTASWTRWAASRRRDGSARCRPCWP
jgi:hypothetical protein